MTTPMIYPSPKTIHCRLGNRLRSTAADGWHSRGAAVSALLLALAMAACGGGGGGDPAPVGATPTPAPAPASAAPTSATLAGQVALVPTPVTVTLELIDSRVASQSVVLSTPTDSNGNFSISAPIAVIPRNSQVAAMVTADGYLPTTIIYATSASGAMSVVSASNALGVQSIVWPISLVPASTRVFAFTGMETLHRLGDGGTTSGANSKFQLPAPPPDQPVRALASQRIAYNDASKTQLQVSLLIRGMQPSICTGARIALRSFDASNTELAPQLHVPADSPVGGDFSSQTFAFTIDPIAMLGGGFQLELTTGSCDIHDFDDMEFVGVTGNWI